MIERLTWTTPDGEKPIIVPEEVELPYELRLLEVSTGKQKESDFLAINPNGRIPAIRDGGTGGRLLPAGGEGRAETLSRLFFQAGDDSVADVMKGSRADRIGGRPAVRRARDRLQAAEAAPAK